MMKKSRYKFSERRDEVVKMYSVITLFKNRLSRKLHRRVLPARLCSCVKASPKTIRSKRQSNWRQAPQWVLRQRPKESCRLDLGCGLTFPIDSQGHWSFNHHSLGNRRRCRLVCSHAIVVYRVFKEKGDEKRITCPHYMLEYPCKPCTGYSI